MSRSFRLGERVYTAHGDGVVIVAPTDEATEVDVFCAPHARPEKYRRGTVRLDRRDHTRQARV